MSGSRDMRAAAGEAAAGRETGVTRIAILAVFAAFLFLLIRQVAFNPSLFIDELAVMRNVMDRDLAGLVSRPLDYDQVAPVGFLALIKATSVTLGTSEFALRIVPLLGVLLAAVIFVPVARRVFVPEVVPVALALFLLTRPMIRTATLVKQYGLDLGVATALMWLGVRLIQGRRVHPAWLAVAVLAPWFSHTAVFILPALALAWLWSVRQQASSLKPALAWTTAWGVSSLIAIAVARRLVSESTNEYMHAFWEPGFWPLWPPAFMTIKWPPWAMREVLRDVASFPLPELGLLLLAIGAWRLLRTSLPLLLLVVVPIALSMIASAFGAYPFNNRTLFFLLPGIAILLAASVEYVAARFVVTRRRLVAGTMAALVAVIVTHRLAVSELYYMQHLRPILERVAAASEPGDRFLVTYGAEQAWHFYAPRVGLKDRSVVFMACRRGPITDYVQDIKGFDHGRVWLIHSFAARLHHPQVLLNEFARHGSLVTSFPPNGGNLGVGAHLIDLDAPPSLEPGAPLPDIGDPDPPGPCKGPAVVRPPIS